MTSVPFNILPCRDVIISFLFDSNEENEEIDDMGNEKGIFYPVFTNKQRNMKNNDDDQDQEERKLISSHDLFPSNVTNNINYHAITDNNIHEDAEDDLRRDQHHQNNGNSFDDLSFYSISTTTTSSSSNGGHQNTKNYENENFSSSIQHPHLQNQGGNERNDNNVPSNISSISTQFDVQEIQNVDELDGHFSDPNSSSPHDDFHHDQTQLPSAPPIEMIEDFEEEEDEKEEEDDEFCCLDWRRVFISLILLSSTWLVSIYCSFVSEIWVFVGSFFALLIFLTLPLWFMKYLINHPPSSTSSFSSLDGGGDKYSCYKMVVSFLFYFSIILIVILLSINFF